MMTNAKVGVAVVGGYLLGRTKKAKVAMGLGMFLAGRRMKLDPQQIKNLVTESPVFAGLNDQVRRELVDATKSAAGSALTKRANSLADSLKERTLGLNDSGNDGRLADDEYPEEDDAAREEAEPEEDFEPEDREPEDRERDDSERADSEPEGPEPEDREPAGRRDKPAARSSSASAQKSKSSAGRRAPKSGSSSGRTGRAKSAGSGAASGAGKAASGTRKATGGAARKAATRGGDNG